MTSPRQVVVGGLRPPLGHERVAVALGDRLRDFGLRVVDVAEEARVGGAGHDARGLAIGLGKRRVVDAIDAEGALLHHLLLRVELAHAVRAGPRAVLAADALVVVDQHDAVLGALVARARGAHRHARRILAVQARLREVHRLRVRVLAHLEGLHAVEERADGIGAVGHEVGERARRCPRCSIPCSS